MAGIAQSVERRALGCEVMGSNLPVAPQVTLDVVESPYKGVKLGPGPSMGNQTWRSLRASEIRARAMIDPPLL